MTGSAAVVDLGTNSTRILVVKDGTEVLRETTVTRLGEGVDQNRSFSTAALVRLRTCLMKIREQLDTWAVSDVHVVATSSARDVDNRADLEEVVKEMLGASVRVLEGDEEGRLAFRGVGSAQPKGQSMLVVDIGGGSTELIVGAAGNDPAYVRSSTLR